MPKTIAITPSWYWPAGIPRVVGVPPFLVSDLCIERQVRDRPGAPALIDASGTLTFAELASEVERRAKPLAAAAGEARLAVLPGALTRENVLQLLAGLSAGVRLRIAPPTSDAGSLAGQIGAPVVAGNQPAGEEAAMLPRVAPASPAVCIDGGKAPAWHSNRSLLAMAISMTTFLDAERGAPWLVTLPLSRWEGLMAVLAPLYLGGPVVLAPERADADGLIGLVSKFGARYVAAPLEPFAQACKDAKRAAKDARRQLAAALLAVDGPFDPDQRRRVGKSLECPALTFWGTAETGPVFAAHPSWYLDESVGLPMTNAHVVPVEPRGGQPLPALWELVEMAEVTAFTPSLMTGYEGEDVTARFSGVCFRTGMMASSDANGMVYLLGEQRVGELRYRDGY
ncbi:MAG: acyl--CoA ligase [Dehalococcoidia bacterium]|nr:acyl--CoA ligase [Dehalococcoidia bacterium]